MPRIDPRPAIGAVALAISAALGATYVSEGGYVNHPADRGGATRFGVTESVAREFGYRGDMRLFPQHCDARNPVCADLIYTVKYIDRPGYRPIAALDPAVFKELFDSAVLHGPPRASGWLQGALNGVCNAGLETDGVIGRRTVEALRACQAAKGRAASCVELLDAMDGGQARFFRKIAASNPSQAVFLKGWLRQRVGNVDRRECMR